MGEVTSTDGQVEEYNQYIIVKQKSEEEKHFIYIISFMRAILL